MKLYLAKDSDGTIYAYTKKPILQQYETGHYAYNRDGVLFSVYSKVEDIIPCWSVGRLLEIFAKCKMYGSENRTVPLQLYADEINGGLVEFIIAIISNYNDLNFSKLED